MLEITLEREDGRSGNYKFYNLPDVCPYCGMGIIPIPREGYFQNVTKPGLNRHEVQVVFQCPISACRALFITQYITSYTIDEIIFHISYDLTKKQKVQIFDKIIADLSPDFINIYNQSYNAEQLGLSSIIGPGYRKSLEFLIKDYAITAVSTDLEKQRVLTSLLGTVIENYIDDPRIQSVAKRASWLGNDETHYIRKWQDKDINDLKNLIHMTVSWILLVESSKKFETDMPDR